ncbi:MAG: aspartate/glutamate racemase family protein [Neisseriaceae bacterium]|nr:aspartate/glutamate racemase family protein [Neisseriaceae bacterium]
MKTIGIIGGMSWESTTTYYQLINQEIKKRLGELHSAKIILVSVDFHEIEQCQSSGDWDKAGEILVKAAQSLQKAGADFIVIATNTMHKVAPIIEEKVKCPILHIVDATANVLKSSQINRVALLGTSYTMKQDFYKNRLIANGIEVIIPNDDEIELINNIIYNELCVGINLDSSRKQFVRIIENLADKGVCAVILGCTEIGLLISDKDTKLPIFDTTKIHAIAAVDCALS